MAYRVLAPKWRYRHCSDLGVDADYCILEFRYAERGWVTVATCHPSAIPLLKTDGVKAHLDLVRMSASAR